MKKVFWVVFFAAVVAPVAKAREARETAKTPVSKEPGKKVIYPENQTIDFEGLSLEGELKTPGEFYFQNRNQERFDSLTKRRVNFRREMLRDSIQSN
ncbi:MAG: hypothetical protein KGP28_06475 [Bdellovibrionales bacterium]|nr:hypothetical protein [Bdellovibrionales bacterium]